MVLFEVKFQGGTCLYRSFNNSADGRLSQLCACLQPKLALNSNSLKDLGDKSSHHLMPDNRFLSRSFRNLLVVNWTPPPPPYQENEPLLGRYRMPDHHAETRPLKNQAKIRLLVVLLFGVFIGYLTDRAYNFNNYEKLWLTWAKEEEHRTSVRSQWVAEFERHEVQRTRMEEEIVKWREEKAAMDTDRRMWEEERERQRVQLVWEDVEPGRCLSYAKREYKATLSNIGIGINGLAECSNKTLVIHGKGVLPDVCNIEVRCSVRHLGYN